MLTNILNLKIGKLYLTDSIDFVTINNGDIKSLINPVTYDANDERIKGIDAIINKSELLYRLKTKDCSLNDATDVDFFISRVFNIDIKTLREKNVEIIMPKYKSFLIRVLKNLIKLTDEEISKINEINDISFLLQYLPRERIDYDNCHSARRFGFLHILRVALYEKLFPGYSPFSELYDKTLSWLDASKEFLEIGNFKFIELNVQNEEVMKRLRAKWLSLINDTYQRAVGLIKAEEEEAIKFEDEDTKLEIQIIYRTLKEALETAEILVENCKTPKELLLYWPEILEPGPIFMYSQ